jgi:hypothetical protein
MSAPTVLAEWLGFLFRILELSGSQRPDTLTDVFDDFPQSVQPYSGILRWVTSCMLIPRLFKIR